MSWQQRDYYSLLGVERGASRSEIERAYRRAARATHPDIHPDDSSAAERFTAVTVAYETLRNPDSRASYDRSNPAAARPTRIRVDVGTRTQPTVAPVHLGRRRPHREPLQPLRASADPAADELFDLVAALARLVGGWHAR